MYNPILIGHFLFPFRIETPKTRQISPSTKNRKKNLKTKRELIKKSTAKIMKLRAFLAWLFVILNFSLLISLTFL
jgi:hypothetical protein